MPADEAAPLLCAGITVYNALRNSDAHAGDLVAVQGIGGLGHLGIQYARQMGFHTVAIGRGGDKQALAKKLGAHSYVDTSAVPRLRLCRNGRSPRDPSHRSGFKIDVCRLSTVSVQGEH